MLLCMKIMELNQNFIKPYHSGSVYIYPGDDYLIKSTQRKIYRTGIQLTHIWIESLSCAHVTRYDFYWDNLYSDRLCFYTCPSLTSPDRLFTGVSAR